MPVLAVVVKRTVHSMAQVFPQETNPLFLARLTGPMPTASVSKTASCALSNNNCAASGKRQSAGHWSVSDNPATANVLPNSNGVKPARQSVRTMGTTETVRAFNAPRRTPDHLPHANSGILPPRRTTPALRVPAAGPPVRRNKTTAGPMPRAPQAAVQARAVVAGEADSPAVTS